jgi:hypothetical protein
MGKADRIKKEKEQQSGDLAKIEILVHRDGTVTVNGFPSKLEIAMDFMQRGQTAVVQYFMNQAAAGAGGGPKILVPNRPPLILPGQRPS